MNSRLETAIQIAFILLVIAFIAGYALGQPVLVSYVTTGSMEPTIGEGDGFLVVPAVLAGPPKPGDVIVFQAETLHNGSVTTHRIVGATSDGYVTKGDANPFTDQEGAEPPVTDDQIMAKAVTVNDAVAVIPGFGRSVQAVKGAVGRIGYLPVVGSFANGSGTASIVSLGAGLSLVGIGLVLGIGSKRKRNTTRTSRRQQSFEVRRLRIAVAVGVVVIATATMPLSSGPVQYGLVSIEDPETDDPLVLETGTVGTVTHGLPNGAFLPVVVIRESPHEDVHVMTRSTVVGPRSSAETSFRVESPDSREQFDRTISERRYVAVLPPSLLVQLDAIHPWLAILAVDTILATVALLVCSAVWPEQYVRFRTGPDRSPWWRLSR